MALASFFDEQDRRDLAIAYADKAAQLDPGSPDLKELRIRLLLGAG